MIQFTPKIVTVLKNGYSLGDLRSDFIAGLTVAIVALPLAMALGIASGASPEEGLVTAIVAGFLISLLGGSRVQIGGPTGAFVVIIYQVIAQHGYGGLLLATLMAGAMLIAAGLARLGKAIRFIPQPVIIGFTTGIAVLIAKTQLDDFWAAPLIGLEGLMLIFLLKQYLPWIPRYLIALIVTAATVSLLQLPVETIGSRFPEISPGFPFPKLPEMSFSLAKQVFPSACIIAFLAGIEALLSAVVADGMTGYRHRSNQELIAQGIANSVSALFGGLPATGAIARTATNITSGGKTPFAGIFHSLFLLLFVLFATDLMKFVPMPALAAVLFFVAWGMSEAHRFYETAKGGGSDAALLLLTFFLTIFVDLTVAIGVGVVLASLLFMVRMSRAVEISAGYEESRDEYQREELPKDVEVFTIAGPIFFGVASEIPDLLKKIGRLPRVLIIRMRYVPFLDASGISALEELVKQCRSKEVAVIFSGAREEVAKVLQSEAWPNVVLASSYEEALEKAKGSAG